MRGRMKARAQQEDLVALGNSALLRGRAVVGIPRPLLIGQAPGPRTNPDAPLFPLPPTSAGGRLFQLTGLSRRAYMALFERLNLLYSFQGRHKRDDRFPVVLGRAAAEALKPQLYGRVVVLVGRNVAEAFGYGDGFLQWCTCARWALRYAILPHPSGRNHWYNDRANRQRAERFLREWIRTEVLPNAHPRVVAFCPEREQDVIAGHTTAGTVTNLARAIRKGANNES